MSKPEDTRPTAVILRGLAKAIEHLLPDHAFVVLIAPFGNDAADANYIANSPREDMIALMKEVIARLEGRAHDAPAAIQ